MHFFIPLDIEKKEYGNKMYHLRERPDIDVSISLNHISLYNVAHLLTLMERDTTP